MKLYSASTRDEALALVMGEMGQDAIILSEHDGDLGYEVRAAVERSASLVVPNFGVKKTQAPELKTDRYRDRLKDLLEWHGAPTGFAEMIASTGSRLAGQSNDPATGFAAALEGAVGVAPIPPGLNEPILIVGPPGSGKTSTVAKLTRRAQAANHSAIPMVADFDATAGGAQLGAYLRQDANQISSFHDPEQLLEAYQRRLQQGDQIVIDTPAINPNDPEDLSRLADLINVLNIEPVLVLSSEGHPLDLEESAKAFATLGIKRCITTKLDVVKRRGSVLYAIASAKMNLSHMSLTPFIGGGLIPATPNRLARVLLDEAPDTEFLKGAA